MADENHEIHDIDVAVHDIDKRLSIVEAGVRRQEGMRKILWGMLSFLVIQFTGAAVGYGKLQSQLEDIASFRKDTSTVLNVLGDHGTELLDVRSELARIRGRDDAMNDRITVVEQQIVDRTKDRWYRKDAIRQFDQMKEWVLLQIEANGK